MLNYPTGNAMTPPSRGTQVPDALHGLDAAHEELLKSITELQARLKDVLPGSQNEGTLAPKTEILQTGKPICTLAQMITSGTSKTKLAINMISDILAHLEL